MKTNKYLFLLFIACLFATLCQGQNTRKSITDSIFQLDPANVLEHINKKVNLLGLDVPLRALPLTVTTLSTWHDDVQGAKRGPTRFRVSARDSFPKRSTAA